MSKQINQYTKTRTSGTVQVDDLLDFDSTEDAGTSYESAKITVANLLAYLNSNISIDNIYTADGSLDGVRTVTANTNLTQWVGGNVIVKMADETFDYSFLVQDVAGTQKARMGYDQLTNSGIITIDNNVSQFFYASNGIVYNLGQGGISTNTSFGNGVFNTSTTGVENSCFGFDSGSSITTGSGNTFVGESAGEDNTTGNSNTFIGNTAGKDCISGSGNIAIGLAMASGNTTGNLNIAMGTLAGNSILSGGSNIVMGYRSGQGLSTGSFNTFVGIDSGFLNNGNSSVFIGYKAGRYETGSNKLFIDNQARTDEATSYIKSLIYGQFSVSAVNQRVTINGAIRSHNFTAAEIASMTPLDGDIVYSTDTDATITSVGFWGYENGAWVKL